MDRTLLAIDYPPRETGPRYGYGRPSHARLLEILSGAEEEYARNLEMIAGYSEDLARVPAGPAPTGLAWNNVWLPPLDAAALYGFMRDRAPRNYVEVGSGVSTLFARRAIDDGGLPTRITSVDPHPRSEVDAVCDEVVREPLETIDHELFGALREGDMLLMDGSHRVLTNSDATVFFLDVLPSLAAGVLVCVHDILLPDDYPAQWAGWHWSEQYLMAAYLLAGGDQIRLELAARYVHAHSDLHRILDPLWLTPQLSGVHRTGVGLWFTTTNRRPGSR
jgi:predicted O-methyltransferase YrrM